MAIARAYEEHEERNSFGDAIVLARSRLNWSQKVLSEKSGVSARAIGSIERGEVVPQRSTWYALVYALENQ